MLLLFTFLSFSFGVFYYLKTLKPEPVRLCGVYSQPGRWYLLKYYLIRIIVTYRQWKTKWIATEFESEAEQLESEFGGKGKARDPKLLETNHIGMMNASQYAVDAVFFNGCNREGWYITLGIAQRAKDITNLFFTLHCPFIGTYCNEELWQNTNVKSCTGSKTEWRTENGFVVRCDEPMRVWQINFDGFVVKSPVFNNKQPITSAHQRIPLSFEIKWNRLGEHFDFDTSISPIAIAHSLAIESWDQQLFDKLRKSHQLHYEQFGSLECNFNFNDMPFGTVSMIGMRDHTISKYRRWTDLRRYVLMTYHLEDGMCVHTTVISMPQVVFSHLEFGYIMTPDGKTHPVDRVYLSLYNHGEAHDFPFNFRYSFDANGQRYNVDVSIKSAVPFNMGLEQKCQLNEAMSEFRVNGIKGYGFVEFEYRKDSY